MSIGKNGFGSKADCGVRQGDQNILYAGFYNNSHHYTIYLMNSVEVFFQLHIRNPFSLRLSILFQRFGKIKTVLYHSVYMSVSKKVDGSQSHKKNIFPKPIRSP